MNSFYTYMDGTHKLYDTTIKELMENHPDIPCRDCLVTSMCLSECRRERSPDWAVYSAKLCKKLTNFLMDKVADGSLLVGYNELIKY